MKSKLFLALLLIVSSSSWTQAEGAARCGCGSLSGWRELQESNREFIDNPKYIKERAQTANGQNPNFVVLSCADSRTPPELIFNQGLGKVFCPRVAGNTAGDQVIDSIAFAVKSWDVNTVVVLGHENCGAVIGALERLRMNNGRIDCQNGVFGAVLVPIERAIVAEGVDIYGPDAVEKATEANVLHAAKQMIRKSRIIRNALRDRQIVIVGSIYSLETGKAREIFIMDDCNM